MTSKDRTILFANRYFEQDLDWDSQDLHGRCLNTILTPASQLFCDSYVIPTVYREGRCCEVQLSILCADDRSIPKIVSVQHMPTGNLSWVFVEADKRTQLFRELEAARSALQEQRETLDRLSRTDPLTGLANRREFDDALNQAAKSARRSPQPVALMILDIDHFKAINDSHGHDIGDKALRLMADTLKTTCRKTDTVARLGGDEFAWVLPNTDVDEALELCGRLHHSVSELAVAHCPVTISIGVSVQTAGSTFDGAIAMKRADQALYTAKQTGRNTTTVWEQPSLDLAKHSKT